MASLDLIPVLGHGRVLGESAGDPRRRVTANLGDRVIGLGAFEPLFGRRAEGVIALAPDGSEALIPFLVDELLSRIVEFEISAIRFVFAHSAQHRTAEFLLATGPHGALRREWLDLSAADARPHPAPGLPAQQRLAS